MLLAIKETTDITNKREHLDDTESNYNTHNMTDKGTNFQNNVQEKSELKDIKQEMVELNEAKVRKSEYFEMSGSDNSLKLVSEQHYNCVDSG